MKKIRISIADDHPMIINGLVNLMAGYDHINVLNTYQDGTKLLTGLTTGADTIPDVLLLDIQMPGKTGDEIVPFILKHHPIINILVLTNFDNAMYVNTMLQHGVHGYILKTAQPSALLHAIETVANGRTYIDPAIEHKIKELERMKNGPANYNLTAREKGILQYIVNGTTSREIAEQLHLSYYTIENYRARILSKMNVKNVAELTKQALILGLVQ